MADIKPRRAGIERMPPAGHDRDAHQVDLAVKHLRELAADPYYHEALIVLSRSGDLKGLIGDPGGNTPAQGRIARRFQHPDLPTEKRPPGRSKSEDLEWARWMLELFSQVKSQKKLADLLRSLIAFNFPEATEDQRKQAFDKLYDPLRRLNTRERAKNTAPAVKDGDTECLQTFIDHYSRPTS